MKPRHRPPPGVSTRALYAATMARLAEENPTQAEVITQKALRTLSLHAAHEPMGIARSRAAKAQGNSAGP